MKDIPKGPYCYTMIEGVYTPCPHWSMREDKPHQENGYCSFLGEGDWEDDGPSLLWDQVKECGVNDNIDEKEEAI